MSNGINFPELVRQIGLEDLATMGQQEVASEFMPAAVTGLADGDLTVIHKVYTGEQAELYGESRYGDGRVARAMASAALRNGMTPGPIYDFQGFAARYFVQPGSPFKRPGTESTIRIHPGAMTIDGNPLELPRVPSLVFDYGACLTGRSYIADQMRFLGQGVRRFKYCPLTRLRFTNMALIHTYDVDYGAGTARNAIEEQLYIGREDGVAAATNEAIRAQREYGASTEVADIVLATGAQHSTAEDLRQGMTNAHILLKEGGMLVVRSLARPTADEIGVKKLTEWAFEAGFEEKKAQHHNASLDQGGATLFAGHFGSREIQTVVLTK